jgi:hypothetical protein
MAIGRGETDILYDRSIAPTLRRCGVQPVRIDRINHNDDIDDRIISEIRKCDFALADLTYARPSAYFEAGLAAGRGVPVVYSCRRDHLSPIPKPDDEFGNFRVHFDLQMKNIVPWSSTSDRTFDRRLERRIIKVIRPLVLDRQAKEREDQEARKFAALSVNERTRLIFETAKRQLRHAGYREVKIPHAPSRKLWIGERSTARNRLSTVELTVDASFQANDFKQEFVNLWFRDSGFTGPSIRPNLPKAETSHICLCCLGRISKSRIMNSVPRLRPTETASVLATDGLHLHIFDNISSEKSFCDRFSRSLETWF